MTSSVSLKSAPTAAAQESAEEALARLSKTYLDRFGHYPPVHRMPGELALESVKAALRSGEPLEPEPFAGSGCNCG